MRIPKCYAKNKVLFETWKQGKRIKVSSYSEALGYMLNIVENNETVVIRYVKQIHYHFKLDFQKFLLYYFKFE